MFDAYLRSEQGIEDRPGKYDVAEMAAIMSRMLHVQARVAAVTAPLSLSIQGLADIESSARYQHGTTPVSEVCVRA